MYVPAAGCIAPAIARNRVGPLPTHSPNGGRPVRARGDQLQCRGGSFPCGTSAIGAAGAQGQDQRIRR